MFKKVLFLSLFNFLFFLISGVWASPPTSVNLCKSQWATSYGGFDGQYIVPAKLELDGSFGKFHPVGYVSTLSEINYYSSSNQFNVVTGYWKHCGNVGWFYFNVSPTGDTFHGVWGYGYYPNNKPEGYWQGTRISLHP